MEGNNIAEINKTKTRKTIEKIKLKYGSSKIFLKLDKPPAGSTKIKREKTHITNTRMKWDFYNRTCSY